MDIRLMVPGLVLFIATHLFTTQRKARAQALARLGEPVYKGLYTLASVVGLVLIVWGYAQYRSHGVSPLWHPPAAAQYFTAFLMLPALILMAASYARGRIFASVRHPMLIGTMLWAAAHLAANGDFGSIILFAAFLGFAMVDLASFAWRSDRGGPPIGVGGAVNDAIAVALGVVAYGALAGFLHLWAFGVPALQSWPGSAGVP